MVDLYSGIPQPTKKASCSGGAEQIPTWSPQQVIKRKEYPVYKL
jgi:hypothetical protein